MKRKFEFKFGSALEALNQQERMEYCQEAAEHLDIPAGLVELIFFDSGDGSRTLCLYIRKGGCDILRTKRRIRVDQMTPCNGEGYIAFQAVGHDDTGRQEIAVGACHTKGLKADTAAMTASTRALRRLTLQFVGGGFLDESEINNEKTSNIAYDPTPLAQIAAQPIVQPSAAPGKDITETPNPKQHDTATWVEILPSGKRVLCGVDLEDLPHQAVEDLKAEPLPVAVGDGLTSGGSTEEPKRHKRRRKSEIDLDLPASIFAETDVSIKSEVSTLVEMPDKEINTSDIPEVKDFSNAEVGKFYNPAPDVSPLPVEVASPTAALTKEQKEAYQARLFEYTNGILKDHLLGGCNRKLSLFVKKLYCVEKTVALTVNQWDNFFSLLDMKIKEVGPK